MERSVAQWSDPRWGQRPRLGEVLGGVEIPHERGLAGHSDADVLAHAVTDALLGAAGLGDIGRHFPDTDGRWRDADSIELLRAARELVEEGGLAPGQVDATVICEAPTLAPHADARRSGWTPRR